MTEAEWQVQQHEQFVKVENVHTKKQLETFIAEKMMMDMKGLPFVFYFLPDFNETSGRFFACINHAYCDAAGIFPILIAFTEEQDFGTLGKLSPPSFWQKLFHAIIAPLSMVELGYEVLMLPM